MINWTGCGLVSLRGAGAILCSEWCCDCRFVRMNWLPMPDSIWQWSALQQPSGSRVCGLIAVLPGYRPGPATRCRTLLQAMRVGREQRRHRENRTASLRSQQGPPVTGRDCECRQDLSSPTMCQWVRRIADLSLQSAIAMKKCSGGFQTQTPPPCCQKR